MISLSDILFNISVATTDFTKVLSYNVNLDVLLFTHYGEIKFSSYSYLEKFSEHSTLFFNTISVLK